MAGSRPNGMRLLATFSTLLQGRERGSVSPAQSATQSPHQISIKDSRRAWLVACAGCLAAGSAVAGMGWPGTLAVNMEGVPLKHYWISAILRQGVEGFTIKLVHSRQPAASEYEAVGIFTRLELRQYPGYAVIKTNTMQVSLLPPFCTVDGKVMPNPITEVLYMVSGAYLKDVNGFDFVLVIAGVRGDSPEHARNRFVQGAAVEYPGLVLVDIFVSALNEALPPCPAQGTTHNSPVKTQTPQEIRT